MLTLDGGLHRVLKLAPFPGQRLSGPYLYVSVGGIFEHT